MHRAKVIAVLLVFEDVAQVMIAEVLMSQAPVT